MNRLLIVVLALMAVNIPMMQAQPASQDRPARGAVQLKTTPLKISQWESLSTVNIAPSHQDVLWDFEDDGEGWTIIDNDGDGFSWNVLDDAYFAYNGDKCMKSVSYDTSNGVSLDPDNWLISPQVPLYGILSLWAMNYLSSYSDSFAVYVCAGDPTNLENYVKISDDITPGTMWTGYTFDLTPFGDQMGRIAIRHYNSYDKYTLFIDDVSVTYPKTPMPEITTEDFGAAIEVTATGEGVVSLFMDGDLAAQGEGSASVIIPFTDRYELHLFTACAQAEGLDVSDTVELELVIPALPMIDLPAPIIAYELTDEAMVVTAVGDGLVTLYVQYYDYWTGAPTTTESYSSGDGYVTALIPRADEFYIVSVWATAEIEGTNPGQSQTEFIEVPPHEMPIEFTPVPAIAIEETDDGVRIIVTGNGELYLYINDELVLFGEEMLEYFIPSVEHDGMEYVIMASAQEDGKEMSEYISEVVYVRGRSYAPVMYYEMVGDCFYIYAQADEAELYFYLYGEPVESPYVAQMTDEEQVLEFSAFAMESGHNPSETIYFTVVIPAKSLSGDADGDGMVAIGDVSVIIDYLLSGGTGSINFEGADVDHDGEITIIDVSLLIDYLLKGTW